MKKIFFLLIFFQASLIQYGQIVADHSIVGDFDKIPAYYMAEVKKMMISFPGESHTSAYRYGMDLLEALYPIYASNSGTGEAYTDQYLRVNASAATGEDVWFTWYAYAVGSRPADKDVIKNYITEYVTHGHPISVLGFGWCSDMQAGGLGPFADPVYGCRWCGESDGGPDGNRVWGLDAADYTITTNRVNIGTYLAATEDYIAYCTANGYGTKVVFTTGTVDSYTGEIAYQAYLKNEYIRNYIQTHLATILFDYADILCYNDDGTQNLISWNSHSFPIITATNLGDKTIGHIGSAGAIRLAKAQWWLLARIAGWDGE